MDLITWTLIVITFVGLYYYFSKKLNHFDEYGIPYVPGWPLLGNMAGPILRRKHIIDMVREIYNVSPEAKYVGAFDFNQEVIVLRDPDLIKAVAIKNFDSFPDHKAIIDVSVDPLFGSNLFNMTGEKWKEARNMLSPAFTSSKMKGMFELMIGCARNFVNHIGERPAEMNIMVTTKDLFTKYTNDVIATCAFGITVNSVKNPDNDFYVLGKKATNLDGLMSLKFFLARAFPSLMKIFKIKFLSEKIGNFFIHIVESTVKMRDEKGISRPDMIQLMMDARGKQSKHLKLDIQEMTAQAFTFFFGGFDSTSTQMCIIAHELAINPDIQRKLQNEIDEVMKRTKQNPSYEDVNGMLYLDAVFNESLRRHTQVSFLDRMCRSAFELPPAVPGGKPFTVKPGTNIWIPAAAIHRDSKYYDDPDKFDPERYYHKKVTINDVTNLAFGIGPRSCIGNRFAILETKILFFFLLSKFNLKANEKAESPLTYSKKSFIVSPEGGFRLTIAPRNEVL